MKRDRQQSGDLIAAATRLVELYDAWDKKDEAAKWRKKLQEEKDRK